MKKIFFTEDHHLTEETIAWVAEVLEDGSPDKIPPEVQDHVMECNKCKQDIFLVSEVFRFQDDNVQHTKHTSLNTRRYSIAAVIILLVALVPWLLYVLSGTVPKPEQQIAIIKTDSLAKDSRVAKDSTAIINIEKKVLASNFTPVPHLELLLGEAQRSTDLKINSPQPEVNYDREILFKWEGKADLLRIVNNKEEKIFEVPLAGNEYKFDKKLEPGLYYWLLESRGEVVAVGKITRK